MDALDLLRLNVLSPVVLAFALGAAATLVRSDLRFPDEVYAALSIYLLLAIGLKGGAELSATPLAQVWPGLLATLVLGVATPLLAYTAAHRVAGFSVADAAALAAHYGSVSVVTFIACLAFLDAIAVAHEPFLPTLVVALEVPAIIIGLVLARRQLGGATAWGPLLHEILAGRSIVLLVGGLLIGVLAGKDGLVRVAPFFVDPFQGALTLFLLEMGMVAAKRLRDLRRVGWRLVGFAVGVPIVHGALGTLLGAAAGLSLGGCTVLGTLAASASYIAAPAAVRLSLPEANPTVYLTASLGLTFPFNLTLGIPLYYEIARRVAGG